MRRKALLLRLIDSGIVMILASFLATFVFIAFQSEGQAHSVLEGTSTKTTLNQAAGEAMPATNNAKDKCTEGHDPQQVK